MLRDQVERPAPIWWLAVLGGLGLNAWVGFSDAAYATWSTYATTALAQSTIRNLFLIAVAMHVGEAVYAHRLATRAGMSNATGWAAQTLLLGFASLARLRARIAATR